MDGAQVAIINVHNSFFHAWDAPANKCADGSIIQKFYQVENGQLVVDKK